MTTSVRSQSDLPASRSGERGLSGHLRRIGLPVGCTPEVTISPDEPPTWGIGAACWSKSVAVGVLVNGRERVTRQKRPVEAAEGVQGVSDRVGEGVDKVFSVRVGAAALPHVYVRPGDQWLLRSLAFRGLDRTWVRPTTRFMLVDMVAPRTLIVESVDGDSFTAIWSEKGKADRRVRFPMSLVAEDDKPLLLAGAIFYWSTGIQVGSTGQPQRVAELRFRRVVAPPPEVWDEARARAQEWFKGQGVGVITADNVEELNDYQSHTTRTAATSSC